jgi:transposase
MNNKIQHKDYTKLNRYYQLVIPFDFEVLIPEDDSVRLLSQLLEELNYSKLYMAYSSAGRNPAVEPKILFNVLTYAYSNNIYSSRKIETNANRYTFVWKKVLKNI